MKSLLTWFTTKFLKTDGQNEEGIELNLLNIGQKAKIIDKPHQVLRSAGFRKDSDDDYSIPGAGYVSSDTIDELKEYTDEKKYITIVGIAHNEKYYTIELINDNGEMGTCDIHKEIVVSIVPHELEGEEI